MLDIRLIREHTEVVRKDLKKRRDSEKLIWLTEVVKLDKEWRELKQKIDEKRHERNAISEEINKLKKGGGDINEQIKRVKDIPKEIDELEDREKHTKEKIDFYLMRLPNILHESVPFGKDSNENVIIKKCGNIKKQRFELRSNGELIEQLGAGDFKKASEVSGAGFYYLFDELALLNQALMQFAIDSLRKKGFKFVIPPLMLRRKPYECVTDLADFEKVMYKIDSEDLYMIATSEHPIGALFMNELLEEKDLPIKIVGMSPCFRKEIGSHGVDTRGLFRVHQFWKVEQFIFSHPKDSWKHHEELQKNSELLYQKLKIPYRVVNICTGDIGSVAAKKYDIEAWFPRQDKYGEVGSNSNCTDYQARRLNIRFINKKGEKEFVHTLNNTALATSRTIVAILENYQQKDGGIKIPSVLHKYMGGFKELSGDKKRLR